MQFKKATTHFALFLFAVLFFQKESAAQLLQCKAELKNDMLVLENSRLERTFFWNKKIVENHLEIYFYDAITAWHFNAQYHCTAKSGIGITISWFNEVMPDIYDRLYPKDSNSKWNFASHVPGIVVVNLFQNDSWLVNMPDHEKFEIRYGNNKTSEALIIDAYKFFITPIRSKYPKAHVICSLGDMDATREGFLWPAYIDSVVSKLNDKKITTHFFPSEGAPGHPVTKDHETMAADLIAYI